MLPIRDIVTLIDTLIVVVNVGTILEVLRHGTSRVAESRAGEVAILLGACAASAAAVSVEQVV